MTKGGSGNDEGVGAGMKKDRPSNKLIPALSRLTYSPRHLFPLTWDRVRTVRQGGRDAALAVVILSCRLSAI